MHFHGGGSQVSESSPRTIRKPSLRRGRIAELRWLLSRDRRHRILMTESVRIPKEVLRLCNSIQGTPPLKPVILKPVGRMSILGEFDLPGVVCGCFLGRPFCASKKRVAGSRLLARNCSDRASESLRQKTWPKTGHVDDCVYCDWAQCGPLQGSANGGFQTGNKIPLPPFRSKSLTPKFHQILHIRDFKFQIKFHQETSQRTSAGMATLTYTGSRGCHLLTAGAT